MHRTLDRHPDRLCRRQHRDRLTTSIYWPRCVSGVTSPRWGRRTLIIMTVFAAFAALTMATCVGFCFGRQTRSAPSTWKKRTSRIALGRRAADLLVLVAARRIRQRLRPEPMVELLGLRILAPLDLLRGSVTRMRSYRGAPGG